MKKIVGLGACVYDTLIECDSYPKEDTKKLAGKITVSGGGPVGNALVVASKLGANCSVLGALADDYGGKYLVSDFEKYGVSTKGIKIKKGESSFCSYILLCLDNGTRTCVFNRGTVKDETLNVDLINLNDKDFLHLDGNYMNCAIHTAKYAKERGVTVSLDAGGLYDGIENLLPYVDILIPSAEFALKFTGEGNLENAVIKLYEKYSPKVLAVTDGKNGGYYVDNGQLKKYPAFKVKAIDSNGAGDTFHGAFLYAYSCGKSIYESLVFASATSAYKCQFVGARTYDLSVDIIEKFIKENS